MDIKTGVHHCIPVFHTLLTPILYGTLGKDSNQNELK